MRILILIIQFPPDTNATGRLMAQVGAGLAAHGHAVTVITAFPHYAQFRIWEAYRGRLAQMDYVQGMRILRLWVYASGAKQRMLQRLASYLSFNALATVAALLTHGDYDVMLCPNGSFFTGIAAFIAGRPRRIPFIYNLQDLYPDVPVKAGQLRSRPAIAMLERMERFMYDTAQHITVITPAFRHRLISKGIPERKISVIPNFVDTDFIRPLPRQNAFSTRHGLDDKFVITHAGNLGYVYDLETMLDAAALLADRRDIQFLIVGEGVAKPDLERRAQALQLRNVLFLPFQPQADLPWLRAASDVQVSLYKRGAASDSMPSKVYEIMASGRPLLASADRGSDIWHHVQATQCGMCIEPGNAAELAKNIETLYNNAALRDTLAYYGRYHAEQNYSTPVVVARYHQLLHTLIS